MKALLWPLGLLYSWISGIRSMAYDRGWFSVAEIETPILSVGNVTAGGTGKTPIIAQLIEWCQAEGIRVGVVSRGYRGSYTGVVKVDLTLSESSPSYFGDEPFMLAMRYPDVPIYLSAERAEAALALEKNEKVDFIIADDAFQHRKMGRKYDLVVIDMTEPLANYLPLPVGRAREPMKSTRRCQFIVLNKVNLGKAEDIVLVVKALEKIWSNQGVEKPILIESSYGLKKVVKIENPDLIWMKPRVPVMLLSGIGNPLSFEKMMNAEGVVFRKHLILSDHHKYQQADIDSILEQMSDCGAQQIITTEKDYVKLREFPELSDVLWVAQLGIKMSENVEEMYEILHRDLR